MTRPTLVVIGGLPAVGKSTVAAILNQAGRFAYVRIDSIEQALRASGEMGSAGVVTAGYVVGCAVAGDLLAGGNDVLVECVNPIGVTRSAWREVAQSHHAAMLEVELFCSDQQAHRERAENRVVDIPVSWRAIQEREYEPWDDADLRLDTSVTSPKRAAELVLAAMPSRKRFRENHGNQPIDA